MSVKGVSLGLGYEKGTFSFSYLKPDAGDDAIYAVAKAINSLQAEPVRGITKTVAKRVIA